MTILHEKNPAADFGGTRNLGPFKLLIKVRVMSCPFVVMRGRAPLLKAFVILQSSVVTANAFSFPSSKFVVSSTKLVAANFLSHCKTASSRNTPFKIVFRPHIRMTVSGTQQQQATLETLTFDNSFVRELPADQISEYDKVKGNMPRQVEKAAFSRVLPTKVSSPKLVAFSSECASLLDLSESECRRALFADIFAGNEVPPGSDPFAACYGGHQFGNWAGQLGDGRAISLGEIINKKGERWELQLKGAGPTPYSRSADGRAVLRSSIREVRAAVAPRRSLLAAARDRLPLWRMPSAAPRAPRRVACDGLPAHSAPLPMREARAQRSS